GMSGGFGIEAGLVLSPPPPPPLVPSPVPPPPPVSPPVEPPLTSFGPFPGPAFGATPVFLLASATTALLSFVGVVWAAGTASGPLVTAVSPPATPERLVPKPIRAATATGTANNAAPATPRATIRRRHHASNPLPM